MHRKVREHWIYSKPEYFYWWFDILSEVNFKDNKLIIGDTLFVCKRGESLLSMVSWAKRWNVNRSKVIRFFKLLESDEMIVLKNEHLTTRLTVCNYEAYQLNENEDEHQTNTKRTPNEHQVNTIKERKEIKKINIEFDVFWNTYDKKRNSKKSKAKWESLTDQVREKIMNHVPKYVLSTPDKSKRKDPMTYFNNESWDDEIIFNNSVNKPQLKKGDILI